jgi:predicted dinucleotide-binding enzyme
VKIGILGTGNIGSTLARKLTAAGHEVRVTNSRGPEGARPLADEVGAVATDARGAVAGADLIILSIPFPAATDLPDDLFQDVPNTVPIVDTSNYYPDWRDPHISEVDDGKAESVWVAEQIGRPVVKAFNNILAPSLADLGRPPGSRDRLAVAVAGDGPAKQVVMSLVDEIGFDPVDGGSLAESWRQQPSTPGYCCDYGADTMRKGIASAEYGVAAKRRDEQVKRIVSANPPLSYAQLLEMNLELNSVE